MKHEPGDFRLVRIKGAAGFGIRIGQWLNGDGYADYEHAAIFLGNSMFMNAQPGGAVPDQDELDPEGCLWSSGHIPLTVVQRTGIVSAAWRYKGTPYSFLDYQLLAAHRLHLWAPGLKHYVHNSKHMICSQLTDQCYVDADVHLFNDGRWPGDVTPGDLWKLLQNRQ